GAVVAKAVAHGKRHVVLTVKHPGQPGDREARDQLLHEDHPAAVVPAVLTASRRPPPHVEAEVDLLEIAVEGDGDALDDRLREHEPDDADVRLAAERVERGPRGHPALEQGRVDLVVQQDQPPPFRAQEDRHGAPAGCPAQAWTRGFNRWTGMALLPK